MAKTPAWQRKAGQNPQGGLNETGRRSYEKANPGSNLKPPVNRAPRTANEMQRQGSFLVRMGSSPGPLVKNGQKTRLKKSLEVWNHTGDKASAVSKGKRLLADAKRMKGKG